MIVHKILEVSQQFFFIFLTYFLAPRAKDKKKYSHNFRDYYSTTSNWAKYSGESYLDGPLLGTRSSLQDF
jgi:hypothetical protein